MAKTNKSTDTKLNLASHDTIKERLEVLRPLFPELFVEGNIDIDRLRQHLGDFSHVGTERYGLMWAGKSEAIRSLQIPSHGTLAPMRKESINFDESENIIIEGDNLEVLKLLQKSYHGKVKLIFIDPPYNTGGDFIYPDNFKEGLDTYLKYSGQATEEGFKVSTNSENSGRYHSNWLNMMYPRLFMAKNLLRNDGAIFISIDDHEVHNLRMIMNEIFGEENFVANVVWQKKYAVSNDDPGIASMHDHILVYQRSLEFERNLLPRTEKQTQRYTNLDNDPRGDWSSDNYVSNKSKSERPTLWYSIVHPKTGEEVWPEESAVWRYSQEKHKLMERENRLYWGPDQSYKRPRLKRFLSEVQDGIVPPTWWPFQDVGHNDEGQKETAELLGPKVFSTPKPVRLLRRIVEIGSNKDDIVLDFFAGSGSTGHAVLDLNKDKNSQRKFILVQLPEKVEAGSEAAQKGFKTIAEITRKRISKVIDNLKSELDLSQSSSSGFRAYRLTSSNFKLWNGANADGNSANLAENLELFADNLLPDRSQEDILFEVLLKSGQPLTAQIKKIKIEKQQVFSIDDGAMLVCLEDPISEATLRGMLGMRPAIMVALDKAFHGNDQLKTNIKLQAESTGESEQSRVLFKTI